MGVAWISVVARIDHTTAVIHVGCRVEVHRHRYCTTEHAKDAAAVPGGIGEGAEVERHGVDAAIHLGSAVKVRVSGGLVVEGLWIKASQLHRHTTAIRHSSKWVIVEGSRVRAAVHRNKLASSAHHIPLVKWIDAYARVLVRCSVVTHCDAWITTVVRNRARVYITTTIVSVCEWIVVYCLWVLAAKPFYYTGQAVAPEPCVALTSKLSGTCVQTCGVGVAQL